MYLKHPVYHLIDEYASWYKDRYPLVGGMRRTLLYRFVKSALVKSVGDITIDHVAMFVGEELTHFYSEQALKAIRNFLWYAGMTGHKCISYKMATTQALNNPKRGRRRNEDMIREVQSMRVGKTPLTYRAIKANLDEKYKRSFSLKNLYLWANYKLDVS